MEELSGGAKWRREWSKCISYLLEAEQAHDALTRTNTQVFDQCSLGLEARS